MEYTGKTRFFSVLARDGGARSGRVRTDHGACDTPCFLPIASDGGLRALSFGQARECGTRMVMANAWYVYRKAGPEVLERAGGAHGHIGWSGALFTDSGGYQVFSLRDNSKIGRDGVSFGEEALTPESVIEMQTRVGAVAALPGLGERQASPARQSPGPLQLSFRSMVPAAPHEAPKPESWQTSPDSQSAVVSHVAPSTPVPAVAPPEIRRTAP